MTDIVERLRDHERSELDICMEAADELERLRAELSTLRAATASVQSDQRGAIDQARELLRIVTVERDALRADAERYRWLRDRSAANPRDFYSSESCWYVSRTFGDGYGENYTGNRIDAAIDAAMAVQTKNEK